MMRGLICAAARLLLGTYFFRIKGLVTEGKENIPAEGAVIIAPNHKSNFDPPAIGVCSPRIIHYMAKEELLKSGLRRGDPLLRHIPREARLRGPRRDPSGPRCAEKR